MADIQAFSELGDFFDQPISTYSSGMSARLGFSVAFQLDPDVLLIDEVLGVGDLDFRRKSSAVMHEKIRSDKTIVLVSHSADTIRRLCDRAVWIEEGETRAYGDTPDVLSCMKITRYQTPTETIKMQIFVIGMHRSGTSLTARLLNLMGAYSVRKGSSWKLKGNPKGLLGT